MSFRSGFAAVVGRPNVGKSTLVNRMVGSKISIVTKRPQTTRNRIMGVVHETGSQLVLLDTPGIHKPRTKLAANMVAKAQAALRDVEAVVFVVDGSSRPGPGDRYIQRKLEQQQAPVTLVVNKWDLVNTGQEERRHAYADLGRFEAVHCLSALKGEGVARLKAGLLEGLPEGPAYFPEDTVTDQPETFIAAETVREKLMEALREELPYTVAVQVDRLEERKQGKLLYIPATVVVERESQKGIVIGKNGAMLKKIGRQAREALERLLATRVYLDLWVKVKKRWRERPGMLADLGLGEPE